MLELLKIGDAVISVPTYIAYPVMGFAGIFLIVFFAFFFYVAKKVMKKI